MKNAGMFALACLITLSSFAADLKVSEKVMKAFETTFTDAEDIVWTNTENVYTVQFKQQGIITYVKYDEQGNFLSSRRYYGNARLPVDIQCKLQKNYPGNTVFGVAEFTIADEVYYFVKLEDANSWSTVKINQSRNMELVEKMKKI